jgi:hypothetical protein
MEQHDSSPSSQDTATGTYLRNINTYLIYASKISFNIIFVSMAKYITPVVSSLLAVRNKILYVLLN